MTKGIKEFERFARDQTDLLDRVDTLVKAPVPLLSAQLAGVVPELKVADFFEPTENHPSQRPYSSDLERKNILPRES